MQLIPGPVPVFFPEVHLKTQIQEHQRKTILHENKPELISSLKLKVTQQHCMNRPSFNY